MSLRSKLGNIYYRVKYYLQTIHAQKKDTKAEIDFIGRMSRYKVLWRKENKKIVLSQLVTDHAMCIKNASVSKNIADKFRANIGICVAESRIETPSYNIGDVLEKMYLKAFERKKERIYLSFGGKIVFRNTTHYKNSRLVNALYMEIRSEIKTKEDVTKIMVKDLIVGDLIYDTYLRHNNKATMDIDDPFLDTVIIETIHMYIGSKELFNRYEIVALVNSYGAYPHWGVLLRLCLKKNIPVFTIGGTYSIVHQVAEEYPSHLNNHFNFNRLFSSLNNKEDLLQEAKGAFEKRFSGKIDQGIGYMKVSSFSDYHNSELEGMDWSKTVVILAHCFFDSPHVYRSLLFPDHYEWICHTLDYFSARPDVQVLIKQHPNGTSGNDAVFEKLKSIYSKPNLRFIDKRTSNNQLIKARPCAVITSYGTPACEFAYFNIPVVTLYDNPFTAYNFVFTTRSIPEYEEVLGNVLNLSITPDKTEILEYYYMQHMHFTKGVIHDYLKVEKYNGRTGSNEFLVDFLPVMTEDYLKNVDTAISKGMDLIEWENKQIDYRK
jgi:hypothetical protein